MGKPVYLSGKSKWARVHTPDEFGFWKLQLYIDEANETKFKALKVMNQVKSDEDGRFLTLRRPTQKMIKGKVVGFTPPEILDKEGKPFKDALIGNGSDVTVKLDYYQYNEPITKVQKHAIRLDAVRIDNLVPYVKESDRSPQEQKQIAELDQQPEPLF